MRESFPSSFESEARVSESDLWLTVEKISAERGVKQIEADELYAIVQRKQEGNLHEKQEAQEDSRRYWELQRALKTLQEQDELIQRYLEKLEGGEVIDSEETKELQAILKIYLDSSNEEVSKGGLSKKKQRLLEEEKKMRDRLPKDQLSAMLYDEAVQNIPQGFETRLGRVSTGRHAKSLNKVVDPLQAAGEFYNATADTHGGKVGYGKKDYYTSKSGKKIRKR
ncbi:MAG: hypothetical protein KGZ30_03740 [Anaplasmataceae bacterium]|nr:hypothetical protein [Anaplasmataceae bacterium]